MLQNCKSLNPFKKLAGDTAIYGMSSIIGRILNWLLTPYFTYVFVPEALGVVTNLYAYAAFFLVLLTYGMETSFFRFASKSEEPEKVYSTSLISLFFTSLSFVLLAVVFKDQIASLINYPEHPEYIVWFAVILAIDAFIALPFARLRLNNRPIKFAAVKLVGIVLTIAFNLFFLSFIPLWLEKHPDSLVRIVYSPEIGVGYVFISNLLASILTMLLLLPEIFKVSIQFNRKLLIKMLDYGFPILIVGLAGIVNQSIDKILIPFLVKENPMYQVGIYGANYKLAVLMNMFIQAFRYAFEPFFFSRSDTDDDKQIYATVMKYFVIFGLIIFLGMILYIDLLKFIISDEYHSGLNVVPIVLAANLFYGIYFALSMWYKLTDKTRYGAYMALIGAAITVILNFALVPEIGYMGSAIAVLTCFFTMMVISYFLGQKFYPVPYNLKRIGLYFLIAGLIFIISQISDDLQTFVKYIIHSVFMTGFFLTIYMLEKRQLKRLFKISKKK